MFWEVGHEGKPNGEHVKLGIERMKMTPVIRNKT